MAAQTPLIDQLQKFLQPRPAGDEAPVPAGDDLPTLIREAQAYLDTAVRQREEALRNADLRIARGKERLAALEAERKRREEATAPPPASAQDSTPEKPKPKPRRR
jgi:hypothetical protein